LAVRFRVPRRVFVPYIIVLQGLEDAQERDKLALTP